MPLRIREIDMPAIGHRVRSARQAKGMSQGEVAVALGIQQSRLSELEHGESKGMRVHLLIALSELLGCSTDWLLNLTDVAP
jgi:transcriptional regulator with XRE-family HTH domain